MNRAVLTTFAALCLTACGGRAATPQPPAATSAQPNPCAATAGDKAQSPDTPADVNSPDSRTDTIKTIKQLTHSIGQKLQKLTLRDDTGEQLDDACAAVEVPDYCSDICAVVTPICDASKRICKLADELSPDPWAAAQCTSGKNSCRRAAIHCCECKQAG